MSRALPVETFDGELAELAAMAAPFAVKASTTAEIPTKVVSTLAGCKGERYGT